MIPAVARERLAEWCDVFCEKGVFTPDESREILTAGATRGHEAAASMPTSSPPSGGSRLAAEIGARSADHLIFVDEAARRRAAAAGVAATLLPIASFYLKLGRFAPARMLIDRDVAVALATDVNPGGGFSPSMPFAMTLACFGMGLTFEEALVGATINARVLARPPRRDRQPRAGQADGRRRRRRPGHRSDSRRRGHHPRASSRRAACRAMHSVTGAC